MPKLRKQTFETAIIERYKRRETSIEEAMIEMYLAGVSARRVEDITEALWGTKVNPSTVSKLNQKIYKHIERWRTQPIEGEHPYVYLDGVVLKRSWGGEVRNISVLVAVGVHEDGHRRVLGVAEAAKKVDDSIHETLAYYAFPEQHWTRIRTNNPLERLIREIRRRTRVVGAFPDDHSALMLCAARLRHVAGTKWGQRRYLDMSWLSDAKGTPAQPSMRASV